MGDSNTSLVNTRIALADAPEAARNLYRHLVDSGAIEAQLRDDVPFSLGLIFPVRKGFAGFDAAIEERYRPCIHGVGIEVTAHMWRNGHNGIPGLFKHDEAGNGLFSMPRVPSSSLARLASAPWNLETLAPNL